MEKGLYLNNHLSGRGYRENVNPFQNCSRIRHRVAFLYCFVRTEFRRIFLLALCVYETARNAHKPNPSATMADFYKSSNTKFPPHSAGTAVTTAAIALKLPDINAIVNSCDEMLKIAAHTREKAKMLHKQIGEMVRVTKARSRRMTPSLNPVDSELHQIKVTAAPKMLINSSSSSATSLSLSEQHQVVRPHSVQQPKLKNITTINTPLSARPAVVQPKRPAPPVIPRQPMQRRAIDVAVRRQPPPRRTLQQQQSDAQNKQSGVQAKTSGTNGPMVLAAAKPPGVSNAGSQQRVSMPRAHVSHGGGASTASASPKSGRFAR